MATEKFNSNEVRQIVSVKRGELEGWISEGYLRPSYSEPSPCGPKYLWSREDIYELAIFKWLIDLQLEPQEAHGFFEIKDGVDNRIEVLFGK